MRTSWRARLPLAETPANLSLALVNDQVLGHIALDVGDRLVVTGGCSHGEGGVNNGEAKEDGVLEEEHIDGVVGWSEAFETCSVRMNGFFDRVFKVLDDE